MPSLQRYIRGSILRQSVPSTTLCRRGAGATASSRSSELSPEARGPNDGQHLCLGNFKVCILNQDFAIDRPAEVLGSQDHGIGRGAQFVSDILLLDVSQNAAFHSLMDGTQGRKL
jgi:hypothetical protein